MNHSKVILVVNLLLVCLGSLQAQKSVTTSGGNVSGKGGSLSYSIGQVFHVTSENEAGFVTHGVQQPYEISIITGIGSRNTDLELTTYPNPTSNFLNLKVSNYTNEQLNYQLLNMQGQLLKTNQLDSVNTRITLEHLPPSIYYLRILNDRKELVELFKVIKN